MKLKSLICLCFCFLLLVNCKDTFQVNADWKDITIIYGLLNQNEKDSIHYIKISRAFLNENTNAIELAKISDSIYYKDSLTVKLEEWSGSTLKNTIYLFKEFNNYKDSGIFSYPGQYLYRTPVTPLNVGSVYKLVVTNPKTGKEMTSQTSLVGDLGAQYPRNNGSISFKTGTYCNIEWYSGKNAYFYDLTIKVNYIEYPTSNPSLVTSHVIQWPVFTYMETPDLAGMKTMSFSIDGRAFFDLMASSIPVNMNMSREFKGFDFTFSSGGQEIFYYISVNKPAVGIIQKKPEYSNINNALGVFSSRNQTSMHVNLSASSITELKENAKTQDLNFVK